MAPRFNYAAACATALVFAGFYSQARGQQPSVEFKPISRLDPGPQAGTVLMKATVANPKDWPASFFSTHPGGACTDHIVVVRIADAAHRRLSLHFCQPLGVPNRQILLAFNRSSQHGLHVRSVALRQVPRRGSASRASCAASC